LYDSRRWVGTFLLVSLEHFYIKIRLLVDDVVLKCLIWIQQMKIPFDS
jgi:hypothetical protein